MSSGKVYMRIDNPFWIFRTFETDVLRVLSKILTVPLVIFLVSFNVYSADITIRLFKENGKIVSDYNKQVSKIKEYAKQNQLPLVVQFSKGISYTVYSVHFGNQNLILDIGNGKVLRIRLSAYKPLRFWNALLNPASMIDSLLNYTSGYRVLKQYGIPVPELTILSGHEKEFLIIEKINIQFSYNDYLDPEFANNFQDSELSKIDNDFLKFVSKTAEFRNIGDFGSNQLVYSKDRGWVLIDFSNTHENYGGIGGNIFEYDRYDKLSNIDAIQGNTVREIIQKPGLPERIKTKVYDVIMKTRNRSLNLIFQCHQLFEL